MPSPVAASLLGGIRGLAAGIPADADPQVRDAALAAHRRLVAHVERAALNGPPDAALGPAALAALLGTAEAIDVDLGALAARADAERDRLRARLDESAALIDPKRPAMDVARELVKDHPDRAGVIYVGPVLDGAGDRVHQGARPDAGATTACASSARRRSRGAGRWR